MIEIKTGMDYIAPPCDEDVEILHQDDSILLVNKPSGLLSVPGKNPLNADSVANRMLDGFPTARIVHRLDMSTSGIMVLGLSKESHRNLSIQFEKRQTSKTYTAIVWGLVKDDEGKIELPLRCDWPNRPKQMVDHENGKPSTTLYKVLSRDTKTTRVELTPITGRSHQLRVHMAQLGHPILGCRFYAHLDAVDASDRLLLHATTLGLKHPKTAEDLLFTTQVPF